MSLPIIQIYIINMTRPILGISVTQLPFISMEASITRID